MHTLRATPPRLHEYPTNPPVRRARHRIRTVAVALATLVLAPPLPACELDDDPCASAKAHLCEKLDAMGCNTALMDKATQRIRTECGDEEGERFVGAAAAWCKTTSDDTPAGCEAR